MATRFLDPITDEEEESLCDTAIPPNSKATTAWGVRLWNEWAGTRSKSTADHDKVVPVTTPLVDIPPDSLAYWLAKFIMEVRKKDGSEYPPKSLYSLTCCFKRFFD